MPMIASKLPSSTGIRLMGKGFSNKVRVQFSITVSVLMTFPFAILISYVTFRLEGVVFNKGANEFDTKLLSAPESNSTLAL